MHYDIRRPHKYRKRNVHVCVCVRLTSVVLHARVVRDSLRPEAEAQDVSGVRAVSDQEGSVRLPLQFHLCVLPVHRTPVPATLQAETPSRRSHGEPLGSSSRSLRENLRGW